MSTPVPRGIIAREWAEFESRVVPEQRKSMQLAFYAGGYSLLRMMMKILDPSTPEPTDSDVAVMDAVHREYDEFFMSFGPPWARRPQ